MKDYIQERVIEIAHYIIETGATVRETAKVFKVSKSTVHKDMSERLPRVNPNLWAGVKKVLDKNKAERHIRGGRATKIKYQMENEGTSHEKNAK
ncbi:MAG: sporulation transcriptional regulator SpoIIID [Caldicoprobacterales bacterium]|nr:sporulation transcriptional regulator SpoIIID [Clostridiales bacterium]